MAHLPDTRASFHLFPFIWGLLPITLAANGLESPAVTAWQPRGPNEFSEFEAETLTEERPDEPLPGNDVGRAVREVFRRKSHLSSEAADAVAAALVDETDRLGLDPLLALAVIQVESNFDEHAVSPAGARGLMQLMPSTHRWLREREALGDEHFASVENVRLGLRYLALLRANFHRLDRALQAYNCGPRRLVDVMNKRAPMPEETSHYDRRVFERLSLFQREYTNLNRDDRLLHFLVVARELHVSDSSATEVVRRRQSL